ncbi:MAG: DUF3303 family protein [Cyclobacteriaceae bacterium]
MIIERFHDNKLKELYVRFEQQGRMLPEGVNFLDSWIDEKLGFCYQLMEAKHRDLLLEWISHWDDLADFDIKGPLISSGEAKKRVLGTKK